VVQHGEGNWSAIARCLNSLFAKGSEEGRIGKQCRERWNHHLRPDIRKDAWTQEEEAQLVAAHKMWVPALAVLQQQSSVFCMLYQQRVLGAAVLAAVARVAISRPAQLS
jgi:hypothetical protein